MILNPIQFPGIGVRRSSKPIPDLKGAQKATLRGCHGPSGGEETLLELTYGDYPYSSAIPNRLE